MTDPDPTTNQANPVLDKASGNGTVVVPDPAKPAGYPTVGTIADWASIAGLAISLFTAWKVLGLSKQYRFAGRISDHKKTVARCSAELNTQLASTHFVSRDAANSLSVCVATLKAMKASGPPIISREAKKIWKKVHKALKRPNDLITRIFTENIQRDHRTLEADLANHIKDRKITGLRCFVWVHQRRTNRQSNTIQQDFP